MRGEEDKHRRWGISRRSNPPIGRFKLTPEYVAELGDEGGELAMSARAGDAGAAGDLVEWSLAVAELAQQSSAHLRREGDHQRDWSAQQQARELEVQVLVRVAGPLLRGAGEWIRGREPHELWPLADRESKLRKDLALLSPSHLGRYPMRPPTVVVPRLRRIVVSGVGVVVGEVPGEASSIPASVRAGLSIFRRGAEARAPWLLSGPLVPDGVARGGIAAPILLAPYDGHGRAGYTHGSAAVRLYLPKVEGEAPRQIAHIIAHEEAHHVWQTHVGADGRAAWSRLVRERTVPLDVHEVRRLWSDEYRHWHFLSAAQHIAEAAAVRGGPLAYQIVIAANDRAVRDLDRRDFDRWASAGNSVMVPAKPVSVYGHTNAEEAFCDAFGLLIARGPRAVDPETLDLLRDLAPGTTVLNPGRGSRSAARTTSTASGWGRSSGGMILGYKVMRYDTDTGEAVSGANAAIRLQLRKGIMHSMPGRGLFLSRDRAYVVQHYAVHDANAVITYAFDPESMTGGSMDDAEPEVSVRSARVVSFELLDEDGAPIDAPPRRRNGERHAPGIHRGARKRGGVSEVVPGDLASLHRYLAMDVNPHDFERFLPRYFGDMHPLHAERSGFDPDSPRGFLRTRHGSHHADPFRRWLVRNLYSLGPEVFHEQSYFHFDDPQLLPKRTWLIHFASAPDIEKIIERGFLGTTDTAALVATRTLKKTQPGWNFAYVVGSGSDRMAAHDELYGDHALLFQAPAVHARHMNDGDWQAIFWGPDVSRAIIIRRGRRNAWDVLRPDGSVAHEGDPWNESLDGAIGWARKHTPGLWRRVGAQ